MSENRSTVGHGAVVMEELQWRICASSFFFPAGFTFNAGAINLFPVDLPAEKLEDEEVGSTVPNGDFDKTEYQLDP